MNTSLFPTSSAPVIAKILVDGPSELLLDYTVPAEIQHIREGCRVEIPLRGRRTTGTIVTVSPSDSEPSDGTKSLIRLIDATPIISPRLMELARWAARYYAAPLEQMVRCLVPESVRQERHSAKTHKVIELLSSPSLEEFNILAVKAPRQAAILKELQATKRIPLSEIGGSAALPPCRTLEKRGFIRISEEAEHRDPASGENFLQSQPLTLNPEQASALESIEKELCAEKKTPILLQGVTGSGKTEVYLQAVSRVVENGGGVLILVPEISLTPQTMQRFRSRFASLPGAVAVLHSSLSDGERFDEWHALRSGKARIAIGPRSAVFAPVQNLSLIIVDEEHDSSYKQENSPRYQGRDLAVLRAKLENAVVILGSATPSLESIFNAKRGKYKLLRLDNRADGQRLPLTRILDMRTEPRNKRFAGILSERLRMAIERRLANGEQSILLLNRRGFARSLQCPDCGHIITCAHCAMPLTYHLTEDLLICHLCGYRAVVPRDCPECHSKNILLQGFGTQKVETILRRAFPTARLSRIDADIARRKNAVRDILAQFRARKIDILLGTQMIAKGLDFPGVTLAGVINADLGLCTPDPRAAERTFQLLTQVAGRAGRGDIAGEVIIQTFTPHAAAIQFARRHDTDGFAEQELALRRELDLPPYCHFALLTVRSERDDLAVFCLEALYKRLVRTLPAGMSISPPAPAPMPKAYGQFRHQCTVKAHSARAMADFLSAELASADLGDDITATLDIDAYSFM